MKLIFDVLHLYYLPQYLPVYKQLLNQSAGDATFVFYHGIHDQIISGIIETESLPHVWVSNPEEAANYYIQQSADWVIFANGFQYLDKVHEVSKSVQLGHGIGPKTSYYTKSATPTSVRFVEGRYRTERLKRLFPNDKFIDVGFCKLDPIIQGQACQLNLEELGLDTDKKTLLYAPTFYPSSIECFPANWPKAFEKYNILIKPHYFSLSKRKYRKQRSLLEDWQTFDNVYLAKVTDYSLVPFLATADLLISDASSALFEFAALDKPIVWCDFLKLRWSYKGPFAFRFKQRMDQDYGEYAEIAVHAAQYKCLRKIVDEQIAHPQALSSVRQHFAKRLAGELDGKASERIINYLQCH